MVDDKIYPYKVINKKGDTIYKEVIIEKSDNYQVSLLFGNIKFAGKFYPMPKIDRLKLK